MASRTIPLDFFYTNLSGEFKYVCKTTLPSKFHFISGYTAVLLSTDIITAVQYGHYYSCTVRTLPQLYSKGRRAVFMYLCNIPLKRKT
jgi:hypothetical protein